LADANSRAIVLASLVNNPLRGNVDSVWTLADQRWPALPLEEELVLFAAVLFRRIECALAVLFFVAGIVPPY
jgi:hypothetical protein